MEMAYIAPVAAIIGLAVAFGLSGWIGKVDEGNDRMKEIAGYIREGSMAFLTREYKTIYHCFCRESSISRAGRAMGRSIWTRS